MQARWQRWQRRLSRLRRALRWALVHWWVILVFLGVVALVLFGCPWIGANPEAQAVIRTVEWRGAFDASGVHQLPSHGFPEAAGLPNWSEPTEPLAVPDETARKMAVLDGWFAERDLGGESRGDQS